MRGVKVGFFGSTPKVLQLLTSRLQLQFKGLDVVYAYSPPFRNLETVEQDAQVKAIRDANVQLLFVGLGCPKQERWMADQKDRIPAVMLGVGAAFDFHAGVVARAPRWVQRIGIEWVHRLLTNPRRLAKRVANQGIRFAWLVFTGRV